MTPEQRINEFTKRQVWYDSYRLCSFEQARNICSNAISCKTIKEIKCQSRSGKLSSTDKLLNLFRRKEQGPTILCRFCKGLGGYPPTLMANGSSCPVCKGYGVVDNPAYQNAQRSRS